MTGPKLNEKSYVAGERSGTKATAKYVRSSASKVRAVLDLVPRPRCQVAADQVLQLTERHIGDPECASCSPQPSRTRSTTTIRTPTSCYVIACFADEGPTLKRFKPRARGRASRILKRTCHITIIVARMSDDRIAIVQARAERQGAAQRSSASRDEPPCTCRSQPCQGRRCRREHREQTRLDRGGRSRLASERQHPLRAGTAQSMPPTTVRCA